MVDPGAAQLIVKQLNRWYRRSSQSRGTIDHFYRGTRMSYNGTKRMATCVISAILFSMGCVAYLYPHWSIDRTWWFLLLMKIGGIGIVALGTIQLLQAFCEFVVVTDDGLFKSDFLGRKTQMAWDEILHFNIKPDDNKVILFGKDKFKLTMSLAYNGWQDFLEAAARRLNPATYAVIALALANVDTKKSVTMRPLKSPWKKPAVTRRSP
jgi:hypothetical protein